MTILAIIKRLRKQKGFTQQYMASQLCMGRSTYSKLESGNTAMTVAILHSIASILGVPIHKILREEEERSGFEWMLHAICHSLEETQFSVVAYDDLLPIHFTHLLPKGFTSREAYENTPLGGRLYAFGPMQAFKRMVLQYNMAILFEKELIQDAYWLKKWEAHQADLYPEYEIDEKEYFTVYSLFITMPGGEERAVQVAERDFVEGTKVEDIEDMIIAKVGGLKGEIACFSFEGYDPYTEIVYYP